MTSMSNEITVYLALSAVAFGNMLGLFFIMFIEALDYFRSR